VAFKNVICLGLVLDSEGQKMSKSRGNIIDPWDVLNTHGADAFRWYLYTASPPGQERRFSVDLVGEVVRNFTLTLWNVYAFFVTYANLDQWTPENSLIPTLSQGERESSRGRGARGEGALQNDNLLDRWLISELNSLVRQVTEALDNYDVTGATRPIQSFVDDLSKWYLRRSRRRFWKSGEDEDKDSAYRTLYQALVTLSRLLAPSMPFLAEALHQNLVRAVVEDAPESVHQADWPGYDPEYIDEALNDEMRLVMRLASLGHAARNQAGIKVRQPLSEAAFSVGRQDEAQALEQHADLLADELNVKHVRVLRSADEAVSYSLKPLPKQLGQKYKGLFPKIAQTIQELEPTQAARALLAGQAVGVSVEGQEYVIQPDEIEVHVEAHSGLAIAAEGAYVASLHTALTPELVREGLAREFVRRAQDLRKQAGLDVADRIRLFVTATHDLAEAIGAHRDYIMGETLAVELLAVEPPEGATLAEAWFDGQWMKVGLIRVE
jgi:isoleucyl-tRNA synthetase